MIALESTEIPFLLFKIILLSGGVKIEAGLCAQTLGNICLRLHTKSTEKVYGYQDGVYDYHDPKVWVSLLTWLVTALLDGLQARGACTLVPIANGARPILLAELAALVVYNTCVRLDDDGNLISGRETCEVSNDSGQRD